MVRLTTTKQAPAWPRNVGYRLIPPRRAQSTRQPRTGILFRVPSERDPDHHRTVYANFQQALASAFVIIFMGVSAWQIPTPPLQGIAGVVGGAAVLWLINYVRHRWFP